jgi:hypothetical protein
MSKRGLVHRLRPWVVAVWLASLAAPTVLLLAQGLEASLADVKGQVQVSRAGSSQYETADANTRLATGDRVRTLANSSARLAFFEGSTTDLAGLTAVRIDDQSQSDTQSSIRLLQAGGVSEAQVQQQTPDKPTSYQVESPAAVASASVVASTCPWVQVGADGTTLVRNYSASVRLGVEPQPVLDVIWVPTFLPSPAGPIPQMVPQLVTVMKELPVEETSAEQPLFDCPFGDQTIGSRDSSLTATFADAAPGEEGGYHLASAEPYGAPLLGRLALAEAAARVEAQNLPYSITVQNTSGDVQTVRVPRGQESQIQPGQPPAPPAPIGTFAAQSAAQSASANAMSQFQAASAQSQAQAGGAAAAAGAAAQSQAAMSQALAQAALQQQLLNQQQNQPAPPTTPPSGTGLVPCANRVGDQCTVTGDVRGAATVTTGMSWSLVATVPAGVPLGTVATARLTTTLGQEQFPCSPVGTNSPLGFTVRDDSTSDHADGATVSGMRLLSVDGPRPHFSFSVIGQTTGTTPTPTTVVCNGTTAGLGLQGSTASVVFPSGITLNGIVTGPGPR